MSNDDADWADPEWVSALMLFPHAMDSRRTYRDIQAMRRVKPGSSITFDHETAKRIARVAHDGFGSQVADATKRGYVAGQYLFTIYAMQYWQKDIKEPSGRKVIKWIQQLALGPRFADGKPVPRSERTINGYIKGHLDVAHLWGASILYRQFWKWPKLLETPEELTRFLGLARGLEMFGCEFKQKRTKSRKTLLNAHTLWRLPESIVAFIPPWTVPPERLIKAMNSYKSRGRR